MVSPEGNEMTIAGAYRVLEPPRRIVKTWAWRQEDGSYGHESEVEITFTPSDAGTAIAIVHRHFDTTERRDAHQPRLDRSTSKRLETHFTQGG